MADLFLNPGFLFVAMALISVPIIIHLINRMRFNRIRWAAMEFLLKAQKRTRRRLIIEQLLLLALRCFLLALVGMLVSRFIGCGDANLGGKPNLHIALIDDTLSMQDAGKHEGVMKSCFDVAKQDILVKKIAKGLSVSKTNDILILLPLSKINDPSFEPEQYTRLNDPQNLKKLTQDINELQPTMLHVNMLEGVKRAKKEIEKYPESRVTLHVLTDFRNHDWSLPAGEGLTKELLDLAKLGKDIKIRPIDCVLPARASNQGSYPASRDNVGIVDVRPSTRIAGHKMPVRFTVSIANYSGKEVEAYLTVRNEGDENTPAADMRDVDFSPQNPIKLSPGGELTTVYFEYGDVRRGLFFKNGLQPGETRFAHLSVRLTTQQLQPLENDGILGDNIRHTVIEVREKVPILVIDGKGADGRLDSKDSFILSRGLISVPGASYKVVFGDDLVPGFPVKALEKADLNQYPAIYLLNVRDLTALQLRNLENYVKEGGGLGVFLGPEVNSVFYNKSFYKDGQGLFPVPLEPTYYPPLGEKEIPPKPSDTYQLIVRDDKYPPGAVPIFGKMFDETKERDTFRNLPIRRYFKVPRTQWKQEPKRVHELATLPNEESGLKYQERVAGITRGQDVAGILANKELAKYQDYLQKHLRKIENKVQVAPDVEFKAYHLASQIEELLNDKGDAAAKIPDMTELFGNSDPKVQNLKRQLNTLREQVTYGDPYIIARDFGKGKVVAVMSTCGKDWNDWSGGSPAQVTFLPFVWELQNYLSTPGGEANLTVGTDLRVAFDAAQFKGAQLKMMRYFMKTENEQKAVKKPHGDEQFGRPEDKQVVFNMARNLEPGLYISELIDGNAPAKPIATYVHTFNVDTPKEGRLQRVGSDELDRELISKSEQIKLVVPGMQDDGVLISKQNDFSESPWLFLLLLLVLVAEQALAVHLSFHLKAGDNETAPAAAGS